MQKHTSPSQTQSTHTTCIEHNSLAKDLLKLQCTAERIISLRFFLLPKHRIKIKTSQKIINFSPSRFSGPKYTCQNFKASTKNSCLYYVYFCIEFWHGHFSQLIKLSEWIEASRRTTNTWGSVKHEPSPVRAREFQFVHFDFTNVHARSKDNQ